MDYIGGKNGDCQKKHTPILPLFVPINNVNAGKYVKSGYKWWPGKGSRKAYSEST